MTKKSVRPWLLFVMLEMSLNKAVWKIFRRLYAIDGICRDKPMKRNAPLIKKTHFNHYNEYIMSHYQKKTLKTIENYQ